MTGLDPARHVIVEIATLLTDDELNIVAEGPDLVIHATEEQLAAMEPIVVDMHTRSGLLDQIRASTVSLEEATAQTLAFLRQHIDTPRSVPLCGNSIGMDRRFLALHMNEVEEFLHYRSVDVSTHQGTGPALVSDDPGHRPPQGRRPPRPRRHQREHQGAPLLPSVGVPAGRRGPG